MYIKYALLSHYFCAIRSPFAHHLTAFNTQFHISNCVLLSSNGRDSISTHADFKVTRAGFCRCTCTISPLFIRRCSYIFFAFFTIVKLSFHHCNGNTMYVLLWLVHISAVPHKYLRFSFQAIVVPRANSNCHRGAFQLCLTKILRNEEQQNKYTHTPPHTHTQSQTHSHTLTVTHSLSHSQRERDSHIHTSCPG